MTILATTATGGTVYAVLLNESGQAYRSGHSAECKMMNDECEVQSVK